MSFCFSVVVFLLFIFSSFHSFIVSVPESFKEVWLVYLSVSMKEVLSLCLLVPVKEDCPLIPQSWKSKHLHYAAINHIVLNRWLLYRTVQCIISEKAYNQSLKIWCWNDMPVHMCALSCWMMPWLRTICHTQCSGRCVNFTCTHPEKHQDTHSHTLTQTHTEHLNH